MRIRGRSKVIPEAMSLYSNSIGIQLFFANIGARSVIKTMQHLYLIKMGLYLLHHHNQHNQPGLAHHATMSYILDGYPPPAEDFPPEIESLLASFFAELVAEQEQLVRMIEERDCLCFRK